MTNRGPASLAQLARLILAAMLLLPGCGAAVAPGTQGQQSATGTAVQPATSASLPSFSHIFIILMENKSYSDIIGSEAAPYLNQLAQTYAVAAQYYGVRHPSLPNYLVLISGSTQGETTDCSTCAYNAPNLADEFAARGKTWRAYNEDLPYPCYNDAYAGGILARLGLAGYARRHNPWMYFQSVTSDPARCSQVVPLSQFYKDLQQEQLPDFAWITPNLQHDMHNGSVPDGDRWLASFVPMILASPAWKDNGLLLIVWDEGTDNASCCNGAAVGGRTLALIISPSGKPGYHSEIPYTHYNLLRTIEQAWGLGYLGETAGFQPMADFFVTLPHQGPIPDSGKQ